MSYIFLNNESIYLSYVLVVYIFPFIFSNSAHPALQSLILEIYNCKQEHGNDPLTFRTDFQTIIHQNE